MSRMERIKDALRSTLNKCREDIEKIHAKGHYPPDYSLGFTNGLIFVDHHLNMRDGEPKFYNRTTSIGKLPKPIALKTEDEVQAEALAHAEENQEYENLMDKILTAAREVATLPENPLRMMALITAIKELDEFIDSKVKSEEAGKAESPLVPDADQGAQEGSTSLPCLPSEHVKPEANSGIVIGNA